jgi:hypothetical protein
MKKPTVADVVYHKTFPRPRQADPNCFVAHIQRHLVPEVREEVQRYFGRIDCLEAQYPGLDYTFGPHRKRLATFQWHKRLFRAFDELRLTKDEILGLCTWEGTRAAKERFERESATKIDTTTLQGVVPASQSNEPCVIFHSESPRSETTARPSQVEAELSDEDETDESVGVHLNQNLMAAARARERGEAARFDVQWEQWMKEALERNEITDFDTVLDAIRQGRPFPPPPTEAEPSAADDHGPVSSSLPPIEEDAAGPSTSVTHYQQLQEAVDELASSTERVATETQGLVGAQASSAPNHPRQRLNELMEELHANTNRMQDENRAMQSFLSRTRTETAR